MSPLPSATATPPARACRVCSIWPRRRASTSQISAPTCCFWAAGQGRTPVPGADAPTSIELVAPAAATAQEPTNAGLQRFLDKRGPGLHHVCFEVEDLEEALASLKAAGVPLIDEVPRPGARGHRVAFLHPAATGGVLFELCAAGHSS